MPPLQAVFFELSGVFLNDSALQFELIDDLLLAENLRPTDQLFRDQSIGKSDRRCLKESLSLRGRLIPDEYLDQLIQKKSVIYQERLAEQESLSIWQDVLPCITAMKLKNLHIGIVTGYCRADTLFLLQKLDLQAAFDVIITADEVNAFKPSGDSYRQALSTLQTQYPDENIQAENCLAIEDNFHGIQAAKAAKIAVVGVAHTYPFHMMQRCSNWCVDYLTDLELERIDPSLKEPEEMLQ
ncbi:MAG: HAD family phosphatase [Limnothrix sp.]